MRCRDFSSAGLYPTGKWNGFSLLGKDSVRICNNLICWVEQIPTI
jgi:hypothetical protein